MIGKFSYLPIAGRFSVLIFYKRTEQRESFSIMAGTPEEVTTAECSHEANTIENDNVLTSSMGEFERSSLHLHLKRQAQLCKNALVSKYKYLPESVSEIGRAFEDYIFNPISASDKKQQEARFNLYPPFAIPERTACYSSFFQIMSIPYSCFANRSATKSHKRLRGQSKFEVLPKFDDGSFVITDGLGSEVTATDTLPRNIRLVQLEQDSSRLLLMKEKLRHVTHFAYPALNLPPKINKLLIENLYKPIQTDENDIEHINYVFTEADFEEVIKVSKAEGQNVLELADSFRKNILRAIQYLAPVRLMEAVFYHAGFIKKVQEILHYTFHHGFIRYIGHITQKNLSDYITFHSMTFENRNNNSNLHTTLNLSDGEDYMTDSIFLFLVMTWQTLVGVWQQNLNEVNLKCLRAVIKEKGKELLYLKDADSMADQLIDWISDNGELIKVFQQCAPDFVSQMQLSVFRSFILARSNIVSCLVPALVKDFVPIEYKESPPRLWQHVYLLNLSYYLYNHGDYCQTFFFDEDSKCPENEIFCSCNLCAPHRVPGYNVALHNEIQAIGTFDFVVPHEGKTERLTLTPGMWANKYLEHFVPEDFYPFEVIKYMESPEQFKEPQACIINKPNILSSLRALSKQKEKFLLERGSGIYLDPETGEKLGELDNNVKLLSQPCTSQSKSGGLHRQYSAKQSKGTRKEEQKKKENSRYIFNLEAIQQ